jgi:transposase-like protein
MVRGAKRVVKQIMLYKDCGIQFRKEQEDVFAKLQTDHEIVALILSMHCRTVSPRGICSVLRETYGIKVSYQTIYNYLKRFEKLLTEYMKSLKPKFSGAVNELYVNEYLFSALDPNTRYLLCTVLTQKKDHKGAKKLFRKLTQATRHNKTNENIKTITSDGTRGISYSNKGNEQILSINNRLELSSMISYI